MKSPATNFILNTKKCALFMPMGHGKTRIVLDAINTLTIVGETRRALVIAPKTVALSTWPTEIEEYNRMNNATLTYSIITGVKEKRITASEVNCDIHIIGADSIVWLIENSAFEYDMLVVDESTKFKSTNAIKYIELNKVVNNPWSMIQRVVLMSGTPIGNSYLHLWSQINLLDNGKHLGKYGTYERIYFTSAGPYRKQLREGAADIINHYISDIVYNEPDDHIIKPDEKLKFIPVELDTETRAIYTEIRDTLQHSFGDEYGISAVNAAVAMNKLLQVCSGHVYATNINAVPTEEEPTPRPTVRKIHTNKMAALKKLRASIDEPVIIVVCYTFERAAILHEFPDAKTISPANIEAWNRGEISELVLHPRSAGHGLNLQFGGRTIIWYTLTWSVEDYMQMNARITRRGQKYAETKIYHLISQHTVESVMVNALEERRHVQEGFMIAMIREELFE